MRLPDLAGIIITLILLNSVAIPAQETVDVLMKRAGELRETGAFDSAYHLLQTWSDTHTLTSVDRYDLLLTQTISAIDARRGRSARSAFASLEACLRDVHGEARRDPDREMTLAEIHVRLNQKSRGCELLHGIHRDLIPRHSASESRYFYLTALCHSGGSVDSVNSYYQAALDGLLGLNENHHWLEAKIRRGLGSLLRNRDPEAALNYHLREAEILESAFSADHIEVAGAHYNSANIYYELLDFRNALAGYQKAYPGFAARYSPEEPYMRFINEAMGDMFWELGIRDSAVVYYDRSVIGEEIVNNDKAQQLSALADSLYFRGETDAAMENYRSALAFREQYFGKTHALTGACNNFIARVFYERGDFAQAIRIYQQSLMGFAVEFNDSSIYQNPELEQIKLGVEAYVIEALLAKADGMLMRYRPSAAPGDIESAQETIQLCMQLIDRARAYPVSEGSQVRWSELAHPVYARAIRIALQRYTDTENPIFLREAFEISEKSKAFTLLQAAQYDAPRYRDLPDEILSQEKVLKQAMADYQGKILLEEQRCETSRASKVSIWKDQLERLYRTYTELLRTVKSTYPDYYALRYDMEVISQEDLQKFIDDQTLILSVFEGKDELILFALTRDSIITRSFVIDSTFYSRISQLVEALQEPGISGSSVEASGIANQLYDMYFADVIEAYYDKKHIVILPDGALSYLPLELIVLSSESPDGVLSRDSYAVSYYPSATLLAQAVRAEQLSVSSFTGIAPEYNRGGFTGTRNTALLKYNTREVKRLAEYFKKANVLTSPITREEFMAWTQTADMLHLAMHAIVNTEEPMLSAFLLNADEGEQNSVFAYEIQSQTLRAKHVVLSACNTGIGPLRRGEGVMSLARCFQYAGCQSLLVSLWPVDDLATSELMQYYYGYLLEGERKDIALQKAKADFVRNADPATRHPFYWAGFILIGNTDPIHVLGQGHTWVWVIAGLGILCIALIVRRFILSHVPSAVPRDVRV